MLMRKIVSLGVEQDQIKVQVSQKTAADENASRIGTLQRNMEGLTRAVDEVKKVQDDLVIDMKRK